MDIFNWIKKKEENKIEKTLNKKDKTKKKRYLGKALRVNISYLSSYGTFPTIGKTTKREINLSPELEVLKKKVLELILEKEKTVQNYTVAWETHQSSGLPHLDIFLVFENQIRRHLHHFDYLLPICPQDLSLISDSKPYVNLKFYPPSRLNLAILQYGDKEDPNPITNINENEVNSILDLTKIEANPFSYFYDKMMEDPFRFDIVRYVQKNELAKNIKNYFEVKSKIIEFQKEEISLRQLKKPGIKPINRQLIEEIFTEKELKLYDAYPNYSELINAFSIMNEYKWNRPNKTEDQDLNMNYFITGPSSIGKSSLFFKIGDYCPFYNITLQNSLYMPKYHNQTYSFLLMDETRLKEFRDNWLLLLTAGFSTEIPYRLFSNMKGDNPPIFFLNNNSLDYELSQLYKKRDLEGRMVLENSFKNRIKELYFDKEHPLHLIKKLIIPN